MAGKESLALWLRYMRDALVHTASEFLIFVSARHYALVGSPQNTDPFLPQFAQYSA